MFFTAILQKWSRGWPSRVETGAITINTAGVTVKNALSEGSVVKELELWHIYKDHLNWCITILACPFLRYDTLFRTSIRSTYPRRISTTPAHAPVPVASSSSLSPDAAMDAVGGR